MTQIVEALAAGQSNISKRLQSLYDAGLINRRREANGIYDSIADPAVFKLRELACRGAEESASAKLSELADKPMKRTRARK